MRATSCSRLMGRAVRNQVPKEEVQGSSASEEVQPQRSRYGTSTIIKLTRTRDAWPAAAASLAQYFEDKDTRIRLIDF